MNENMPKKEKEKMPKNIERKKTEKEWNPKKEWMNANERNKRKKVQKA